jgi:hypothetical protein
MPSPTEDMTHQIITSIQAKIEDINQRKEFDDAYFDSLTRSQSSYREYLNDPGNKLSPQDTANLKLAIDQFYEVVANYGKPRTSANLLSEVYVLTDELKITLAEKIKPESIYDPKFYDNAIKSLASLYARAKKNMLTENLRKAESIISSLTSQLQKYNENKNPANIVTPTITVTSAPVVTPTPERITTFAQIETPAVSQPKPIRNPLLNFLNSIWNAMVRANQAMIRSMESPIASNKIPLGIKQKSVYDEAKIAIDSVSRKIMNGSITNRDVEKLNTLLTTVYTRDSSFYDVIKSVQIHAKDLNKLLDKHNKNLVQIRAANTTPSLTKTQTNAPTPAPAAKPSSSGLFKGPSVEAAQDSPLKQPTQKGPPRMGGHRDGGSGGSA